MQRVVLPRLLRRYTLSGSFSSVMQVRVHGDYEVRLRMSGDCDDAGKKKGGVHALVD